MPPKRAYIGRHPGGRRQKRGKKASGDSTVLSPEAALSSPAMQVTIEHVHQSIESVLDLLTDDQNEKIRVLSTLVDKMKGEEESTAAPPAPMPTIDIELAVTEEANGLVYDADAFRKCTAAGVPYMRSKKNARQAKYTHAKELSGAFNRIPTPSQKLLTLHSWLNKNKGDSAVAMALRSVKFGTGSVDIIANLKEVLLKADSPGRKRHADSIAFRKTILMAIAPTRYAEGEKVDSIKTLGKFLGCQGKTFHQSMKTAIATRKAIMTTNNDQPLMQRFQRKASTHIDTDLIQRLHHWLFNNCDQIVASPHAKDTVLVRDLETGVKVRQPKYMYMSSVREIHNEMIDHFDGARVNGKVVISDTTLRSLLPKNLSRMTDSHKEMCGCEDCLVPKQLLRTFNSWAKRYLSRVDNQTGEERGINTADKEQLRSFVLDADSRYKFEHPRDVIEKITCATIEQTGLFPLKCCLGRCHECPSLDIPAILLDKSNTAEQICYQDYQYHSYCKRHFSIPLNEKGKAPTTCAKCLAENEADNKPVAKVMRKKHLTRHTVSIGLFMETFLGAMQEYKYHLEHVMLLGKHHTAGQRKTAYERLEGAVLIQRDFADRLVATFTDQIQSTHFGENSSISMEGLAVRWGDGDFHYHSYIADDSKQDSRAVFVNTEHVVLYLRENEEMLQRGSTLYELMDGCAKQYRSGTALMLVTVLAARFGIAVDRMIQAPHHGKGDCDSQGGIDKNYLRQYFRRTIIPGNENTKSRGVTAHTVESSTGKRASIAERLAAILQDPSRSTGVKGHNKHRKREGLAKIQERHYHVIHAGNTDQDANVKVPVPNSKFVAKGFTSKKGQKHNGLMAHYHFYADPNMDVGKIAARRIPCACTACLDQLEHAWDRSLSVDNPLLQPKFKTAEQCSLKDVLGGYNDWRTLDIIEGKDYEDSEVKELYEMILDEHEAAVADSIIVGDFGAVQYDEKKNALNYYVVRWTSAAMKIEELEANGEQVHVEGCDRDKLVAGTVVCTGRYWSKPGRAKQWYVPNDDDDCDYVFRVQYCVCTGLAMDDPSTNPAVKFPTRLIRAGDRERVFQLGPRRVSDESHETILAEIARRARIDFEENNVVRFGPASDDNGQADSDSNNEEGEGSGDDID